MKISTPIMRPAISSFAILLSSLLVQTNYIRLVKSLDFAPSPKTPLLVGSTVSTAPASVVIANRQTDRQRDETVRFVAPLPPDTLSAPGQRSGAASRSCGVDSPVLSSQTETTSMSFVEDGSPFKTDHSPSAKRLTALVPIYELPDANVVFGLTSVDHPTVWFYVPYQAPYTAEFVLNDQIGHRVYETEVELPEAPGIIRLSLPVTAPVIEPGEPYQWFFKVYCQSSSSSSSLALGASPATGEKKLVAFVDGWLQRTLLPPATTAQLDHIDVHEQVAFYSENGFWQEALTLAATLQHNDAADDIWASLLGQVGLEEFAAEPIAHFSD